MKLLLLARSCSGGLNSQSKGRGSSRCKVWAAGEAVFGGLGRATENETPGPALLRMGVSLEAKVSTRVSF